jgi:hypothetical protein
MSTLDDAIQAIRMGDKDEGRQILEEMLEADEGNEQVWLWLCTVVDTNEDREVCLENVLALNPDNAIAQKALNDARSGRFNAHELMSAAIGEMEEEEEPAPGASFIDEFRRASEEEEEDDELVMPSTMAKSKAQKKQAPKKQGSGFKLNPRLVIMAVLVLLVVCGLAGAAAYNLFLGGGGSSVEATVPVTPAGSGGEVQPTDTPIPAEATPAPPTDTPTATRPPLLLPTQKPTDLPTPTATQVVAPTP